MRVRVVEDRDRPAWEAMLASHPMSRSVYPMYFLAASWRELPIGLWSKGQLVGGLLVATRPLARLPINLNLSRMLCVMVGPEGQAEMLRALLSGFEAIARRKRLLETEVQIRLPAGGTVAGFEQAPLLAEVFGEHGYRRLPRAEKTYFVRIDQSDEALLASFGQQPRNRIRKAKKDGSEVVLAQDPALLELFYESYLSTADRKDIHSVLDRNQVVESMRPLLADGRALLFAEKYGEQISNLIIVDPRGVPCAMLAARTRANVDGAVPSCAQAVHFEAMRAMRERGHRWYDFGGCEGPVPIESHPNYGVWRFKHAFKGAYVVMLPYLRKIRGELTESLLTLMHRHRGDPVSLV